MSRDGLLDDLRATEARLRSPQVQAAYRERPEAERRRLAAERAELSLLIERLTTAELASITGRLDDFDKDLKTAMVEVRERLAVLERPVAALNAIARLLGLVARVAVLAG
jgi:hypothetical protein